MDILPELKNINPEYLEKVEACPFCKKKETIYIFTENGFPYYECNLCELIFLQTRLKEKNVDVIYNNSEYHKANISPYHFLIAKKRLAIFKKLPKGARLHEDAAGIGNFVSEAQRQGFSVTGSDLGMDSVNKAKDLCKVDILHGNIQSLGFAPQSLDAFAAFNLFSHLYEPWEYIRYVSSLLKPGGQFLASTANRIGFLRYLYKGRWGAPQHVYHFHVPLIKRFFSEAGLEVIGVYPAFDSDFPYLFYDMARTSKGFKKKIAAGVCRTTIKFWNIMRLPKDDVYVLARKVPGTF